MINIKDITHEPTINEIQEYIQNPIYLFHHQYMLDTYQSLCTIQFSKDVWLKGWNIKYKKAGKSLCVVYPKEQYFTILVVVGKKEKEQVEELLPRCTKELQSIYNETIEGMGQRWLMIDIKSNDALYEDVLNLIQIRRATK